MTQSPRSSCSCSCSCGRIVCDNHGALEKSLMTLPVPDVFWNSVFTVLTGPPIREIERRSRPSTVIQIMTISEHENHSKSEGEILEHSTCRKAISANRSPDMKPQHPAVTLATLPHPICVPMELTNFCSSISPSLYTLASSDT